MFTGERTFSTSLTGETCEETIFTWHDELKREMIDGNRKVHITEINLDGTRIEREECFGEFQGGALQYRDWELLSMDTGGMMSLPNIIESRVYNKSIIFCTDQLRVQLRQDTITFFHSNDLDNYFIDGFEKYILDFNNYRAENKPPVFELYAMEGIMKYVLAKHTRRLCLFQAFCRGVISKSAELELNWRWMRRTRSNPDQRKLMLMQTHIDNLSAGLSNMRKMLGDVSGRRGDLDCMILSPVDNITKQRDDFEMLFDVTGSRLRMLQADAI